MESQEFNFPLSLEIYQLEHQFIANKVNCDIVIFNLSGDKMCVVRKKTWVVNIDLRLQPMRAEVT